MWNSIFPWNVRPTAKSWWRVSASLHPYETEASIIGGRTNVFHYIWAWLSARLRDYWWHQIIFLPQNPDHWCVNASQRDHHEMQREMQRALKYENSQSIISIEVYLRLRWWKSFFRFVLIVAWQGVNSESIFNSFLEGTKEDIDKNSMHQLMRCLSQSGVISLLAILVSHDSQLEPLRASPLETIASCPQFSFNV